MLLAMIAPQSTPVTQLQTDDAAPGSTTQPNVDAENAGNQLKVVLDETGSSPIRTAGSSPGTTVSTAQTDLEPNTKATAGTPAQVPHQTEHQKVQPDTPATPAIAANVKDGIAPVERSRAHTEAAPQTPRGGIPSVPETATQAKSASEGAGARPPLPEITIESAEISNVRTQTSTESRVGGSKHSSIPARPQVVAGPNGYSAVSLSKPNMENAHRVETSTPPKTSVGGESNPKPALETTSAESLSTAGKAVPQQPPNSEHQPAQSRMYEHTRAGMRDREGLRDRQGLRPADSSIEDTESGPRTTRIDKVEQRVLAQGDAEAATGRKRQPNSSMGSGSATQADLTSPVVGARNPGGAERSVGHRPVESQVGPAVQKTSVEDAVFQPKPEDRVTLKFTDDGGVEGRLRVALRGDSVRATIVSGDPAIAERIGSGISELQRVLDKQGFRDPQITVQ